jgi:phage terminase small subunit
MELVRTGQELNAEQRAFCREYHSGEHSGNGTKCYQLAYSVVSKPLSDSSASSCSSALLKDPRIQAYLKTLREAKVVKLQDKLSSWESLAAEAQQTVLEVMRGECRSRMRFEGALHILDRALGRVVNRTELEVALDADEVLSCLHALASRTRLLT